MKKLLLVVVLLAALVLSFWIYARRSVSKSPVVLDVGASKTIQPTKSAHPLPPRNTGDLSTSEPKPDGAAGSIKSRNLSDAEKARVVEDPELREYAMRETVRDWTAFFAGENFSKEKEDVLVKLLVDRTLAISMNDRESFDELIAQVITAEELKRFVAFRDDVPIKHSVADATRRIEKELGAQLESSARIGAETVIRAAPLNHDLIWKNASELLEAGHLTVADLPKIEALARQKFEQSLQQNAGGLSETERAALRRWFETGPLAFNMRALNNGLKARQ